jgi:tetratricopeptide (TPR) repeat protein
MTECLRQIKWADCTIALPSKFDGEIRFPSRRWRLTQWFCKTHILVLDDLQNFFIDPNTASRLIDVARQKGFIILANCRSSGEWQTVRNVYDTISKSFVEVNIPEPTESEVNSVVAANDLPGIPSYYDEKNIGTLIIDLDTMRDRFSNATLVQKKILLCLKELHALGIANDSGEIEGANILQLAEKSHNLVLRNDELNREEQWVVDNDFATMKDRGLLPDTVYLSQIIEPNYSLTDIIENGLGAFKSSEINFSGLIYSAPDVLSARTVVDLMKAKNITVTIHAYNKLIAKQTSYDDAFKVYEEMLDHQVAPDKQTFYALINIHEVENDFNVIGKSKIPVFKRACEVFSWASKDDPPNAELLVCWGIATYELERSEGCNLAKFKQACERFKRATEINPDSYAAFHHWGNALTYMARLKDNNEELFREACDKFDRATEIRPDLYRAFFDWGNALHHLAKDFGINENLLQEACKKYERATEIRPDLYRAFYNWGNALCDLAEAKSNDEQLFCEACKKYERATEIKSDFHEAFYNWGVALDDLAKAKGGDNVLFEKACKQYKKVTEIKPDQYKAFNNWGVALDKLAHRTGNINLFEQSCNKFRKATEIKPDFYIGFQNWGTALHGQAEACGNDENLIREGFAKYERAINIKPDYHEVFLDWKEALACASEVLGENAPLVIEAKRKLAIRLSTAVRFNKKKRRKHS